MGKFSLLSRLGCASVALVAMLMFLALSPNAHAAISFVSATSTPVTDGTLISCELRNSLFHMNTENAKEPQWSADFKFFEQDPSNTQKKVTC